MVCSGARRVSAGVGECFSFASAYLHMCCDCFGCVGDVPKVCIVCMGCCRCVLQFCVRSVHSFVRAALLSPPHRSTRACGYGVLLLPCCRKRAQLPPKLCSCGILGAWDSTPQTLWTSPFVRCLYLVWISSAFFPFSSWGYTVMI